MVDKFLYVDNCYCYELTLF